MLKSDEFEFVMPEDDKCVKKGLKIVIGVITVFIGPNGSGKTTVMRKMASEVGGSIYIPTNRNTLAIYTIKSRKKRPSNINEAIEYFLYACYSDEHYIKSDVDRKGVGKLMKMCIELGRKTRPDLEVGICGEQGGDPNTIEFCHIIGLNYVSCSPYRVPIARLAAAQAAVKHKKEE